jgi:hypothetical protein
VGCCGAKWLLLLLLLLLLLFLWHQDVVLWHQDVVLWHQDAEASWYYGSAHTPWLDSPTFSSCSCVLQITDDMSGARDMPTEFNMNFFSGAPVNAPSSLDFGTFFQGKYVGGEWQVKGVVSHNVVVNGNHTAVVSSEAPGHVLGVRQVTQCVHSCP